MSGSASQRKSMVASQIAARGIRDPRLLAAMAEVPRERFVAPALRNQAYADRPLPIEAGQTISQPYIVALMIDAAAVDADDRVLEIGAGSGYAAAVLSRVAGRIHAIERHAELADLAAARLAELGYANVTVRAGDGTAGWPEAAPFDAILVSASGRIVPRPLLEQLAIGGRLVMPLGPPNSQHLVRVTREGPDAYRRDDLGEVRFVPLIGEHGWPADPEPHLA